MLEKIRTQETRHLSHEREKASMGEKRSALTRSMPGRWAEPEVWAQLGAPVSVQDLPLPQINVDLSNPVTPYLQNGETVLSSQGFVKIKIKIVPVRAHHDLQMKKKKNCRLLLLIDKERRDWRG